MSWTDALVEALKNNPDHMLVMEEFIAVLIPVPDGSDRLLVVTGDFKGISEEEANLKLQEVLRKMQ